MVFIPGLEEQLLPGPWRQPYPGLVLEAARLLYVSLTRARAACIISYAQTRMVNGQFQQSPPSRFVPHLGGVFAARIGGLRPQRKSSKLLRQSLSCRAPAASSTAASRQIEM